MDEEKKLPAEGELKESEETVEDVSEESPVEETPKIVSGDGGEETVTIKKSDHAKLIEERDNYKRGLLVAKGKGEPKKEVKVQGDDAPVTRGELYAGNEKKAIREATTASEDDSSEVKTTKEEINEHWGDIMKHFSSKGGKTTPEDILEDIYDAHAAWKRRNNVKPKDTKGKEITSDLAASRGQGGKSPKPASQERKRILPKSGGMESWYPDK